MVTAFQGRFVNEWSRLHDDHTYNVTHHNQQQVYYSTGTYKRTLDQWYQDITTVLWAQWTWVWKIRNEVVHGKDEAMQCHQRQQEDLRRLRHIYIHPKKPDGTKRTGVTVRNSSGS
jgi:hypothetical protein